MNVISLFAGAGGMDLGFKNAGHRIVWANDNWDEAVRTYEANLGKHIVCANIEEIRARDIPQAEGLIGGFPCQGFSVANAKRHTRDKRNLLYLQFLRVLVEKKPLFFVAENVKGILSLDRGTVFGRILEELAGAGYRVSYAVLNAADYGVPQRRERVFLMGSRVDIDFPVQFPPPPTHAKADKAYLLGLAPWNGVGSALCEIPEPDSENQLLNHEHTKYKLRFNGYLGHRRIDPALPSPTLTARGDSRGGVVIHHHPSNTRRLSVREAAIIQSFPIDFEFFGSKTSCYRQIANAVPPRMAYAIARLIPQSGPIGKSVQEVAVPYAASVKRPSRIA